VARPVKPWHRKQTGWWMVEIDGVQTKLVKGPKDQAHRHRAEEKWVELRRLTRQAPEAATSRTADVVEAFLRHSRVHLAPDTHRLNRYYCQLFAEACGQVSAREMRPFHVARWIDPKVAAGEWGETTVYNARKGAFRAFSLAPSRASSRRTPWPGCRAPSPPPDSGRSPTPSSGRFTSTRATR
jgi:hypothetical protein